MTTLTSGSLCTGTGGLDLAVKEVFPDAVLKWTAEIDPAASKLIDQRFPGVPNLGDIKAVDWGQVEKVDILTAGIPCQPWSEAGRRKGIDDNRDLSGYFLKAVRVLQPKLTILENVSGFRRRGLGRVLAGLAEMGMDARWHSVRAADAGAPHQRWRVFLAAYPADDGQQWRWSSWKRGGGS